MDDSDEISDISISFGNYEIPIFKIERKPSGIYLIPKIINPIGLHFSAHPPNERHPKPRFHIKSNKGGIYERISFDDRLYTTDYWLDKGYRLFELLRRSLNPDLGDIRTIVFPKGCSLIKKQGTRLSLNPTFLLDGEMYMTEARKLPRLLNKLNLKNSPSNLLDTSLAVTDEKEVIMAVDNRNLMCLNYDDLWQTLFDEVFRRTAESFNQAISKIMPQFTRHITQNDNQAYTRRVLEGHKMLQNNWKDFRFKYY